MATDSVWPAVLKKLQQDKLECFAADESDHFFEPSHRALIVQGLWTHPIKLNITPQELLRLFSLQLAALADGKDLVVGILKKGMSLLMEVNVDLNLPSICSDDNRPLSIPSSHRVLVVDDSVHNGKVLPKRIALLQAAGAQNVSALVLIASQDGLNEIKATNPSLNVEALITVPERVFGSVFQLAIVPAMEHYRVGALSNRQWKVIEASAPRYSRDKAAMETLVSIASDSFCNLLEEIPPFFEKYPPVFRGTLHPTDGIWHQVESALKGKAKIDQMKLRLFIDPGGSNLRLQMYGIVWLIVPPNHAEEKEVLEMAATEKLLELAVDALCTALSDAGYTVRLPSA